MTTYAVRLAPVVFAAFVCTLGFGSVIPSLPLYLRHDFGASTEMTGFVVGIASAAALGGRLIAGRMADTRGRRVVVAAGLGFCAAAGIFYLPWFGLPTLIVARILHGLGEGFLLTAAVAWTVDLAPMDRRSQILGFLASGVWGGLSAGPIVGEWIGGLPNVGWFVAGSVLPALAAIYWTPEVSQAHAGYRGPLVSRIALLPGTLLGLSNVSYAAMAGFVPLLLKERGLPSAGAFVAFAAMVVCGRTIFGSLPDRLGPIKMLYTGLILLITGSTVMLLAHSPGLVLTAACLLGLGYSFPWPSLAIIVTDQAPAAERATALGTLTGFYDLFVAVSAVLAGALAARFGVQAAFWLAISCAVAALAIVKLRLANRR
ncbi:MAG: MFS transporter [Acidobacteria bacterium]|nr:MFS transporter [Acidobacteriota bacterium]